MPLVVVIVMIQGGILNSDELQSPYIESQVYNNVVSDHKRNKSNHGPLMKRYYKNDQRYDPHAHNGFEGMKGKGRPWRWCFKPVMCAVYMAKQHRLVNTSVRPVEIGVVQHDHY
jgi:hypothetical protein